MVKRRGRWLRTILMLFEAKGVLNAVGPVTVELRVNGARHEEADAREGGRYFPCPASFDGRSGVLLSSTRHRQ